MIAIIYTKIFRVAHIFRKVPFWFHYFCCSCLSGKLLFVWDVDDNLH